MVYLIEGSNNIEGEKTRNVFLPIALYYIYAVGQIFESRFYRPPFFYSYLLVGEEAVIFRIVIKDLRYCRF